MADPQFSEAGWQWLMNTLRELRRLAKEASKPSGSQVVQAAQQILDILNNLDERVSQSIQNTSYTRAQIDARDSSTLSSAQSYAEPKIGVLPPSKGGTGQSNSYNNDLANTTRRASWVDANGNMGIALSTQQVKQDIEDSDVSEAALRAIRVVRFRYRQAVDARGDDAPVEFGVIAEQVEGLVPGIMLYRDGDGKVVGFEYMLSGLLGLRLAQMAHDRIDCLTAAPRTRSRVKRDRGLYTRKSFKEAH
jgi:hypothetical protein